jgi:hypothetical protein
MDKTAIKSFSIWARNKLIADITYKAGLLGITEEGIKAALPQSTQNAEFYDIGTKEPYVIHGEEIRQRKELVSAIRKKATQLEYKDAYRNVIEEVAYTWFNRLIAIRFMEINDYMPAHIRVLSSESGTKLEPDLVTTPFDAEIEFTQQETEHIIQMKNDNQVDALFRFLFIKQCNALNVYLPKLFEKTSDYTELLLNVSVTDQDGIVYQLTHGIQEDDFNISNIGEDGKPTGQVEIIGWMYQYYNTEPKDEVFSLLKSNIKITKERIPAATQLFTPDWIVRYMVENSVGRLWLEGHGNEELKKQWIYYLDEAEQEADVEEQLKAIRKEYKNIKPEEIKVMDPCMGSGHILVYAFDVLMQIYESYGYSQRDAAKSIVENNIYGLDIDDRAFQLAYFAIMMKARSYNRRFLTLGIEPNLCAVQESNGIQYDKDMGDFLLNEEHRETLQYLLHIFVDAKEYGSILHVEKRDYDGFLKAWEQAAEATLENIVMIGWYMECNQVVPILAKQAKFLSQKYDVVVTNPPYMAISNGNTKITEYVKRYYPNSKTDMFAVFIEKGNKLLVKNGYQSMVTQHAWMFLSSYKKLRETMQKNVLVNMAHLGARAFDEIAGEVVQTTSFVLLRVSMNNYVGTYNRLVNVYGEKGKEELFLSKTNEYYCKQNEFACIPGIPYAYWANREQLDMFTKGETIGDLYKTITGSSTGENATFLRLWFEVEKSKIGFGLAKNYDGFGYKWIPCIKGGAYRKWYGNIEYLINWDNDGEELKNFATYKNHGKHWSRFLKSLDCFYHAGITWSKISTGMFSARYMPEGFIMESAACAIMPEEGDMMYILALMNSSIVQSVLKILNPTINIQVGDISSIPVIDAKEKKERLSELAIECMEISKEDWDCFETSWDFVTHPLVCISMKKDIQVNNLENMYLTWENECQERINKLQEKEMEIDNILRKIYGITEENDNPKINSLYIPEIKKDIESLLSYAVGCMFGRYSLDKNGLVFVGDNWDMDNYTTFLPDRDNIILITDEEYFEDDIVGKLCEWIRIVYGEKYYEQNIAFIANALDAKGSLPKEKIRNYFLTDFFKDHCATYSTNGSGKRPIYWLFDSGKQNGFKALIYMHRYNADTIGNLRIDYLHRMERIYESEINRMQDTIDNSSNAREVTTASKRKEKLQKQLKECQEYDEKIGHLALSRIEIDLDDGVKVNYEKVQTAHDGKKYQVLAKI